MQTGGLIHRITEPWRRFRRFFSWTPRVVLDTRTPVKGGAAEVTFDDVVGLEEAKRELSPYVALLKSAKAGEVSGVDLPKGILLTGPSGYGKSLLAQAIAGEAEGPRFYLDGPSFAEFNLGAVEQVLEALFAALRRDAPVVLIVEDVDLFGPRLDAEPDFYAEERERALRQFLLEMDRLPAEAPVLILGTTRCPEAIDHALLQPGYFDRRVALTLPNEAVRTELCRRVLERMRGVLERGEGEPAIEGWAEHIARKTAGFSPEDLVRMPEKITRQLWKTHQKSRYGLRDFEEVLALFRERAERPEPARTRFMEEYRPVGCFREFRHMRSQISLFDHIGRLPRRNKGRILRYLRQGREVCFSFSGGEVDVLSPRKNAVAGSRYLSDGVWYWTEALPYFVLKYDVDLPAPFVAHMRQKRWRVPRDIGVPTFDMSEDLKGAPWWLRVLMLYGSPVAEAGSLFVYWMREWYLDRFAREMRTV